MSVLLYVYQVLAAPQTVLWVQLRQKNNGHETRVRFPAGETTLLSFSEFPYLAVSLLHFSTRLRPDDNVKHAVF